MFKRANKMAALLVAAAAVISIVPTGVSAADNIKSEKGEIYNAVAYKDGKFYIGGKPDKKDSSAYYISDGKYSELEDIDSEDKAQEYGTKYVEVEDGDHYVDLSTGKVTDDKIEEKDLDEVSVNLRSKVKSDNDGRYDAEDVKSVKDLTELPNSKFAEDWYSTQYKVKEAKDTINAKATSFNVYTDKDGKYIDADYNIGKIRVVASTGDATIENTSDNDEAVSASVSDAKVIGQDTNNIYRLAKITVKCSTAGATIKSINGIEVGTTADSLVASSDKASVSFDVIQVISKAEASKDVDGIKVAKSTSTYIISDKDGKKIELLNNAETGFTVADGKLINYKVSSTEIEAEVLNLKSKGSYYYVEKGDNDHVLLKDGENSVDIDASGNLWALAKDNLYKFDNSQDFEKIYSVDEEYTNLSVYDKDNIVVWDADEEVYSIVGKKATTVEDPTEVNNPDTNTTPANPVTTVTPGWVKDSNGKWSYNNADGTKYKGWLSNGGAWYYLEADGIMATGWKQLGSTWYYLQPSGAMKTGWLDDNGTWYYLDGSGAMLSNTYVGGYKLGPSGAWIS